MTEPENQYGRILTDEQIERGEHRDWVGGFWEEIGKLQLSFLRSRGLLPHHLLLDVGCGALRGGVHFVRYLNPFCYFGMDRNDSLLRAGVHELHNEGLAKRGAMLLANETFEFVRFHRRFDFVVSVSLFTHLNARSIVQCLIEVEKVLQPSGEFYATFFRAPGSGHDEPIEQSPGIFTHALKDPFHYSVEEIADFARVAALEVEFLGPWGHPRGQLMLRFFRATV